MRLAAIGVQVGFCGRKLLPLIGAFEAHAVGLAKLQVGLIFHRVLSNLRAFPIVTDRAFRAGSRLWALGRYRWKREGAWGKSENPVSLASIKVGDRVQVGASREIAAEALGAVVPAVDGGDITDIIHHRSLCGPGNQIPAVIEFQGVGLRGGNRQQGQGHQACYEQAPYHVKPPYSQLSAMTWSMLAYGVQSPWMQLMSRVSRLALALSHSAADQPDSTATGVASSLFRLANVAKLPSPRAAMLRMSAIIATFIIVPPLTRSIAQETE